MLSHKSRNFSSNSIKLAVFSLKQIGFTNDESVLLFSGNTKEAEFHDPQELFDEFWSTINQNTSKFGQ